MDPLWLALLFLLLVALSAGSTALVMSLVRRARIYDLPNERSSHTVPTARGGGITIVIMVTLAGLWVILREGAQPVVITWLVAGLLLATLSFADDFRPLPAVFRLPLQALAVVAFLVAFRHGWPVLDLPGLPAMEWSHLGWLLLFLWILGLTNVYNFMDGIDGIAGTQGLLAGLGWMGLGLFWNDLFAMAAGMALAASCAGFLVFNWSPAKIFMGDVGSAFLGFVFAAMPMLVHARNPETGLTVLLGCAVLLVWPFLFDGGYTILHRIRRRENLLKAHRSHLYQRMVIAGVSHARVSLLYGVLAVTGWGLAAWWVFEWPGAFWGSVGILLLLAGGLVARVKFLETRAVKSKAGAS